MKDVKISHEWGSNINIIQSTNTIQTILFNKKPGVQTNVCKLECPFLGIAKAAFLHPCKNLFQVDFLLIFYEKGLIYVIVIKFILIQL